MLISLIKDVQVLVLRWLQLGEWFEAVFSNIQKLPRPLVPSQFDAVITGAYVVLREMALQQLSR